MVVDRLANEYLYYFEYLIIRFESELGKYLDTYNNIFYELYELSVLATTIDILIIREILSLWSKYTSLYYYTRIKRNK